MTPSLTLVVFLLLGLWSSLSNVGGVGATSMLQRMREKRSLASASHQVRHSAAAPNPGLKKQDQAQVHKRHAKAAPTKASAAESASKSRLQQAIEHKRNAQPHKRAVEQEGGDMEPCEGHNLDASKSTTTIIVVLSITVLTAIIYVAMIWFDSGYRMEGYKRM